MWHNRPGPAYPIWSPHGKNPEIHYDYLEGAHFVHFARKYGCVRRPAGRRLDAAERRRRPASKRRPRAHPRRAPKAKDCVVEDALADSPEVMALEALLNAEGA